jgi:hypothetical protein
MNRQLSQHNNYTNAASTARRKSLAGHEQRRLLTSSFPRRGSRVARGGVFP